MELQALLDKHDSQTQKQFAEQLSIVNKLFLIAYERWERLRKSADELNKRQMERRKNTCEILLERYRRKSFLHRIVTGNEKWIFLRIPSVKNHGRTQVQKIRRTIHIDRKTESLWQEDDALCLVGLEGCGLL